MGLCRNLFPNKRRNNQSFILIQATVSAFLKFAYTCSACFQQDWLTFVKAKFKQWGNEKSWQGQESNGLRAILFTTAYAALNVQNFIFTGRQYNTYTYASLSHTKGSAYLIREELEKWM